MVHFAKERWEQISRVYDAWWNKTLDRPLIKAAVRCYDPDRPAPEVPILSQENCSDFSITPEQIIDAFDYELSQFEFLGDNFPMINFDSFGPGVVAAFCGAKLDNSSGRVWFFPEKELPVDQIHIRYDPENKWVKRIKEIYKAGLDRWEGNVLLGMPDLGGNMDIIASFRGSENLLMDLYDAPEEVHRLREETYTAWMAAYNDLSQALKGNPGYSDWDGLYSNTPSYVLQCDFCYMIGTEMFDEFVLPDLQRACKDLDHTIYHLDGIGELNHLEHILKIPELDAVQWVYGEGKPSSMHWLDVYRKIAAAGKGMHILGSAEDLDAVRKAVPGCHYYCGLGGNSVEEVKRVLQYFGCPGR